MDEPRDPVIEETNSNYENEDFEEEDEEKEVKKENNVPPTPDEEYDIKQQLDIFAGKFFILIQIIPANIVQCQKLAQEGNNVKLKLIILNKLSRHNQYKEQLGYELTKKHLIYEKLEKYIDILYNILNDEDYASLLRKASIELLSNIRRYTDSVSKSSKEVENFRKLIFTLHEDD